MDPLHATIEEFAAEGYTQARARLDCVAFPEAVAISPPPGAGNVLV
jgi:hypothetical protein